MTSLGCRSTTSITANIERILQEGGTPQCSVWVELPDREQFSTTVHRHPPGHTMNNDRERDGTMLYNIGSLTKIFVAYALVILVERLASSDDPEYGRFRELREAWNKGVGKYLDIRLPGEPTIDNLLSHFKGLPTMNDFIFGPDGTVLMTTDEFPEIAEHIAWEDYNNNGGDTIWRYGNGSYILAGILIETYSEGSLAKFLEDNVFRPYNMTSTYASRESFDSLPQGAVALPHIISTDLSAQEIECPRYFDTPAFAAMGIYSCTKDLATFFRKLLDILANESIIPDQDIEIVKRFVHPCVKFEEVDKGWYSFCGLHTNLCTSQPGRGSLNRLVTTAESNASCYTLGAGETGQPLEVIHGSGIVTGYECCFYFMRETNSFVIVLSNATGLVDTSDHISRLLLQDMFDLKYKPLKPTRLAYKMKPSKAIEVNFIEKARLGAQERRQFIDRVLLRNLPQATPWDFLDLVGHYSNEKFHQHVTISYNMEGVLQAQICGTAGCSRPFRIVPIDRLTLALTIIPQDKSPFLSVDAFRDWKSLDFVIGRDQSGNVLTLTRSRETFSVVYTRTPH
jgi:CubicO group peptidase (beta-lactamase class C family)